MIELHASSVCIDGAALLLRGPSGAGKSDLALRLIDGGALLVADDRVCVTREGQGLVASAPPALAGLIEVRGLGILPVPSIASAPLQLVVDLIAGGAGERLPPPRHITLCGSTLPVLALDPRHASAAAFLRLALRALRTGAPLVPGEAAWSAAAEPV